MRLSCIITCLITLVLLVFPATRTLASKDILLLERAEASRFAQLALGCVNREFPNKPSHVMHSEDEVRSPAVLHPAFYGCFDWHSSVHGHWMLVRLLRRFPDLPEGGSIRAALDRNLTEKALKVETAYMTQKGRKSFERTYGWAWLLRLAAELHGWEDPDGRRWRGHIRPLEAAIVNRYMDFLPRQTYPIRTGVHPNTAFGIAFALDYARTVNNPVLAGLLESRARDYFAADRHCPAHWEPGGEDFFSPCLMEADLMRRVLPPAEFTRWFDAFLPDLSSGKPTTLLTPASVTDRSDGKLVHLDGLNLSRAWCMLHVAAALPKDHPARSILEKSGQKHTASALAHVTSGDYAGEHWLASFAVYLLTSIQPRKMNQREN